MNLNNNQPTIKHAATAAAQMNETRDEFGDFSAIANFNLTEIDQMFLAAALFPVPALAPAPFAETPDAQTEFLQRLLERQSPSPNKKQRANLFGAERYGIRKAHHANTSVNKVYLHGLTVEIRRVSIQPMDEQSNNQVVPNPHHCSATKWSDASTTGTIKRLQMEHPVALVAS